MRVMDCVMLLALTLSLVNLAAFGKTLSSFGCLESSPCFYKTTMPKQFECLGKLKDGHSREEGTGTVV